MAAKPLVAVIGADGFVGGGLADGLHAERVVYGPWHEGEVHISEAEPLLRLADVVINAGGFRVRRGLTYSDYQRCHQGATSVFMPWIKKDALFIHMSSAHVLGKNRRQKLGNRATPDPATYPSAAYALAKLECDKYVAQQASERGFRVVYLRPTILWARQGDTSLPDHLVKMAKRGKMLRIYPRDARHHLCNLNLLVEVASRLIAKNRVPHLSAWVVADPFTITNRELEEMVLRYVPKKPRIIPVPAQLMSMVLRHTFASSNPKYDLRTWGDIFGVLHLDTEYDPTETFEVLGIDATKYSIEKTLEPFVRRSLQTDAADKPVVVADTGTRIA